MSCVKLNLCSVLRLVCSYTNINCCPKLLNITGIEHLETISLVGRGVFHIELIDLEGNMQGVQPKLYV